MGKKRVLTIGVSAQESEDIKQKAAAAKSSGAAKNLKKMVVKGQAYIQSTYNNTIVTLADDNGRVLAWSSAGSIGFKGTKKSTPYAASLIVKNVVEKVKKLGLKEVNVFVKGIGSGRDSAIRSLAQQGLIINAIKDVTPVPHNGCRQPKPRRI
ncbi:30S ribosomal protein S11 [Patescibacteria group bacterium]|nr:30S ribosomal protein S11 [Patescibacteria group bacterium]MBU4579953.1 30S ribosomal protein S11 [Patescibacteria group bacterium]